MDFAIGLPSLPSALSPGSLPYAEALGSEEMFSSASFHVREQVAGNGMMIPQVCAWMLYCSSNTVRKDKL